jgi:folate-binding protein YgfZ
LLSVQGPKAAETIGKCPENAMALARIEDPALGEIYLANHPRQRGAGFDLFVPVDAMREMAGQLLSRGGRLCGWQALETARMEAGIPRFGADMDETNLAPEALDQVAISYSKGCYIGQEVIARVRTYGQVAKSLRGLKLEGDIKDVPVKGAKLFLGDKEVGYITGAVRSPMCKAVIALGYVRRGANETGAKLLVQTPDGKVPAMVVEPSQFL